MIYKEFRESVLALLNQYTASGVIIDNLYNDQSDYVLRIPFLYNSAVSDIALSGKPYIGEITKDDVDPEPGAAGMHGLVKIDLPDDFIKLYAGPLVADGYGRICRDNTWYAAGPNSAFVKESSLNNGVFLYEREPTKIPTEPGADIDMLRLDGDAQQQDAAKFYVAAHLAKHDDAFVYSALWNEYDDRISKMNKTLSAEIQYTADSYDSADLYGGFDL